MNKNFKIIQVQGLSGLLLLGLTSTLLFCVFVILPVWIIMSAWNCTIITTFKNIPEICFMQASLLWLTGALMFYSILRKYVKIGFSKEIASNHSNINFQCSIQV